MDTKFKLVVTLEEKGKRRELETIHNGFSCILNILFQFIKKISSKDGKMLRFATLSGRCMDVNSNYFTYFFGSRTISYFLFLAASGLSCGMWDLPLQCADSLAVLFRLSCCTAS